MKKVLFTLVALLISAIVIYGGSGVNMYFFCCDDCRHEGAAAIIEHKCCEIHHSSHSVDLADNGNHEYICDLNTHDSHCECEIERISVDWTYSVAKIHDLNPVIISLHDLVLFADISNLSLIDDSQSNNFKRKSQQPPDLSKEVYFNLLTTLII